MLAGTILAILSTFWMGKVDDPADVAWIAALSVLAVPYASAVLVALGSTLNLRGRAAPAPDLAPVYPASTLEHVA